VGRCWREEEEREEEALLELRTESVGRHVRSRHKVLDVVEVELHGEQEGGWRGWRQGWWWRCDARRDESGRARCVQPSLDPVESRAWVAMGLEWELSRGDGMSAR
jgi:hypothetical protein